MIIIQTSWVDWFTVPDTSKKNKEKLNVKQSGIWISDEHKIAVQILVKKKKKREREGPGAVRYLSVSFYVKSTGADSFFLHGALRLN